MNTEVRDNDYDNEFDDSGEGLNNDNVGPGKLKLFLMVVGGILAVALILFVLYVKMKDRFHKFFSDEEPQKTRTINYSPPSEKLTNFGRTEFEEAPTTEAIQEPVIVNNVEPRYNAFEQEPQSPAPVEDENSLINRRLKGPLPPFQEPPSAGKKEDNRDKVAAIIPNISYTLLRGTQIPCITETRIVSEQPGFTSCIITNDIYSSNARVLLIEKGSKVTGFYDDGLVNGEKRLSVVWDRIITPNYLAIKIDSPTAGRLGAVGLEADVDNRWGLRVGSALLISFVDDLLRIESKDDNSSAQVVIGSSTAGTTQDIANTILEKNIDLPPIGYVPQATLINIVANDDIDLSHIYGVKQYEQ